MYQDSPTENAVAVEAGFDLATSQQEARTLTEGGIPFIIGPNGTPISLEKFLPAPLRHSGLVALEDVASFVSYVNAFKQEGTLVFVKASLAGSTFTALLDYALPDKPTRQSHTASLALVATPDWLAWMAINAKWQPQQTFCEFVEKQRHVFSEPSAADMLEISRSIEAKQEGSFKSGVRLANGDRTLIFEGTTAATAGVNKIEIPDEITIQIVPFEGGDPVLVSAFLRYRIEGPGVKFMLEFQRPEEIIRAAVKSARDSIASATGLTVLAGSASSRE